MWKVESRGRELDFPDAETGLQFIRDFLTNLADGEPDPLEEDAIRHEASQADNAHFVVSRGISDPHDRYIIGDFRMWKEG